MIIAPISKISNGLNKNCFIPFSRYQAEKWFIYNYPKTESICAYLPASILFYIENYLTQEKITINQEDNDYLKQFINQTDTSIQLKPNSNLIIILVESMESWIFELNSMPKLSEYINNYPNIFAQSIKRQVMGGQSGDGQMIINTGLLPIKNGVACMLYGNNTYPNIAHNYTYSTTINPYPQIWNQNTVTYSYGYKNLIEFDGNDQKVFETLNSIIDTISIDFCIQAITLDTHLPYTLGEKEPLLNLPKETPKDLKNYLNCFKHLDNNLDIFLQKYFNSKILSKLQICLRKQFVIILLSLQKKQMPLITVITICYNIKSQIERTLISVANQTYTNFQWVIIDGNSIDGTLDVIKKYQNKIDILISEKDNGIYNAMNKGIKNASGKYLVFLNGGDEFYDNNSLEIISKNINNQDIISGNCITINNNSTQNWITEDKPNLFKKTLPHNATYIKKILFDKFGLYNENLKIAADYEFFIKCFKQNIKFEHINHFISKFYMDGISNNNNSLADKENKQLLIQYYPIRYFFNQTYLCIRYPRYLLGKLKQIF